MKYTEGGPQMPVSRAGKLFYILIPLIIYECILLVGESAAMIVWLLPRVDLYYIAETGTIDQMKMIQDLSAFAVNNGLLFQSVLSVPSTLLCLYLIRKDLPRRRFRFDHSSVSITKWIALIPFAILFSAAGNMLLNIGDYASSSESFSNASQILNAGSVLVQVIGIGFVCPICEELVMRGLVYMRMRQFVHVNYAILFSALLFALIHGNMVQGVYAFILGVVFAWFYEKYGSILAPVLMHVTANLTAMGTAALLDRFLPENGRDMVLFVGGVVFAAAAMSCAIVLSRSVSAKRIYADSV